MITSIIYGGYRHQMRALSKMIRRVMHTKSAVLLHGLFLNMSS